MLRSPQKRLKRRLKNRASNFVESDYLGSRNKTIGNLARRQSERGQIVVEYVLLLLLAVTIAVTMTRFLISRDPGDKGMVIEAWEQILTTIGQDNADDKTPEPP